MKELKLQLMEAWEGGLRSYEQNKDRDDRLEKGTKQIEEEYNFENWFSNKEMLKTKKYSFEESSKIANEVIEGYSELKKLNETQIGSAQLLNAMEKYHELISK